MVHELFAVLGLRSGASKTDVRQAYLRLAKQWHPDSNKDPGAGAKFKAISEAYEKLKDGRATLQKKLLNILWSSPDFKVQRSAPFTLARPFSSTLRTAPSSSPPSTRTAGLLSK